MALQYMIERVEIGAAKIGGMVNASFNPGIEALLQGGSNELDPSLRAINRISPEIVCQTTDIKALLDALDFASTDVPHKAATAAATIDVFLQRTTGTDRGAAASNIILRVEKGILTPTTLSSQGGVAVCGFRIDAATKDAGATPAVQKLTGQNLSAGTGGAAALWRLYAVEDEGAGKTLVPGIRDGWTIDFGVAVQRIAPATDLYPTNVIITGFAPSAQFSMTALKTLFNTLITAINLLKGLTADSVGLHFYLAQYDTSTGLFQTSGALKLTFRAGSPWHVIGLDLGAPPIAAELAVRGLNGAGITDMPLVYVSGQTVPTITNNNEAFMLGPVKDATTADFFPSGGRIEFGLDGNLEMIRPADLIGPSAFNYRQRTPTVRIDTPDAGLVAGLGEGRAVATSFDVALRNILTDGQPDADASLTHMKIKIAEGTIEPAETSGDHGSEAQSGVLVTADKGGGDIMTITIDVAM